MKEIKDNDFDKFVQGNKLCVIDCWADWCGPCKDLAPHLEKAAKELKDVAFAKMNVMECDIPGDRYGVQSIPTLLLLKEGRLVDNIIGFRTKMELMAEIKGIFNR